MQQKLKQRTKEIGEVIIGSIGPFDNNNTAANFEKWLDDDDDDDGHQQWWLDDGREGEQEKKEKDQNTQERGERRDDTRDPKPAIESGSSSRNITRPEPISKQTNSRSKQISPPPLLNSLNFAAAAAAAAAIANWQSVISNTGNTWEGKEREKWGEEKANRKKADKQDGWMDCAAGLS